MQAQNSMVHLCSLTEWSVQHIRDVFEAHSDELSLRAIAATFSESLRASVNDVPLNREGIKELVMAMRRTSRGYLRVYWQQTTEVPSDPTTNRVSLVFFSEAVQDSERCVIRTEPSTACTLSGVSRRYFRDPQGPSPLNVRKPLP